MFYFESTHEALERFAQQRAAGQHPNSQPQFFALSGIPLDHRVNLVERIKRDPSDTQGSHAIRVETAANGDTRIYSGRQLLKTPVELANSR